jgi:hypothetical protein
VYDGSGPERDRLLVRFLVLLSRLSRHGKESGGFEEGGFIGSTSAMGFGAAAWDDRRALLLMKRVRGFVLRAERTILREMAARGLDVLILYVVVQICLNSMRKISRQ